MDKKGQIGILDVPNEILFQIFRQLTIQDVQQNVALVCKRFFRISRMDGMVTSLVEMEFDFFSNELEVEKNVSKIRLLLEQHPRAQLKLKFREQPEKPSSHNNVYQVARLSSSVQSIKAIKFVFNSNLTLSPFAAEEMIPFEAVEELEITKDERGNWKSLYYSPMSKSSRLLFLSTQFWRNFPNLKSLTFHFYFDKMVRIIYQMLFRYEFFANKMFAIFSDTI